MICNALGICGCLLHHIFRGMLGGGSNISGHVQLLQFLPLGQVVLGVPGLLTELIVQSLVVLDQVSKISAEH